MGVSKNNGTPKWMVKIMENMFKMDDLGVKPPLFLVQHPYAPKMLSSSGLGICRILYPNGIESSNDWGVSPRPPFSEGDDRSLGPGITLKRCCFILLPLLGGPSLLVSS